MIELVRPANLDGLDNAGLRATPERLRLSVKRQDGINPLDIVRRVRGWADGHWSDVRIQVTNKHRRSRVVRVGREEDAATTLFVQSELVKTDDDLPMCSEEVSQPLLRAAKRMFADQALWS